MAIRGLNVWAKAMRVGFVLGLLGVAPTLVLAQTLVQDGELDVRAGVLYLNHNGDCCPTGTCQGAFVVANRMLWDGVLANIDFTRTSLTGVADSIVVDRVSVEPNHIDGLGPNATQTVVVKVDVADTTSGGRYRGEIQIEAHGGVYRGSLPVEANICVRKPAISIVAGVGDFDGNTVRLNPTAGDCRSDDVTSRFVVANSGQLTLANVEASLADFAGVDVVFLPAQISLAPGEKLELRLSANVQSLPAGVSHSWLTVRDRVTGAMASVTTTLDRCAGDGPTRPPIGDGPLAMTVTHRFSKSALRPGEVVTLRVTVTNDGRSDVSGLSLVDVLPRGFVYSTGRTAVDGAVGPEPVGSGTLRWSIGDLRAGATTTIAFQVSVTSAARRGEVVAHASVQTADNVVGPVDATTEVVYGSMWLGGVIDGTVHNVAGEAVEGVRVLLDYDSETTTDVHGKFEFTQVRPGEHLVAVDLPSLPAGYLAASKDRAVVQLFSGASATCEFVLGRRARVVMRLEPTPVTAGSKVQ